jgi:MinD superfamily P-loop ATPase
MMKEIVTLSGKGGAGKSSITAVLGHLLSKDHRLVLADTDVDAPNLSLVLGATLESSQGITASDKARIDYDLCSGCMACADACRFSSIIGSDEPVIVGYSCEGCGACTLVCPEGAVRVQPVENGTLSVFKAGSMRIVAGELGIGESSSGRLVDTVKQRARQDAQLLNCDLLLTDGPPGIGCPVIASIKGSDYVILVTEPTPSALSDLKRVVEVVRFFKIQAGVVLNRADLHGPSRELVLSFLRENELELLVEVPVDPLLPEAMSRGGLAVEMFPDAPSSVVLRKLGKKLDSMLRS